MRLDNFIYMYNYAAMQVCLDKSLGLDKLAYLHSHMHKENYPIVFLLGAKNACKIQLDNFLYANNYAAMQIGWDRSL